MIYFIGMGDLIKIGFTDNLKQRIESLEDNLPMPVEILGVMEGDEVKEMFLHQVFQEYHINREWFKSCDAIRNYIEKEKIPFDIVRRKLYNKQFYELKKMRLKEGFTLANVAERMGLTSPAHVDRLERKYERGKITVRTLKRYLEVLGYEFKLQKKSGGSLNSQG